MHSIRIQLRHFLIGCRITFQDLNSSTKSYVHWKNKMEPLNITYRLKIQETTSRLTFELSLLKSPLQNHYLPHSLQSSLSGAFVVVEVVVVVAPAGDGLDGDPGLQLLPSKPQTQSKKGPCRPFP